jgi:hypothetical protein
MAGREVSAARRTALYIVSTLARRWRLGASELTKRAKQTHRDLIAITAGGPNQLLISHLPDCGVGSTDLPAIAIHLMPQHVELRLDGLRVVPY